MAVVARKKLQFNRAAREIDPGSWGYELRLLTPGLRSQAHDVLRSHIIVWHLLEAKHHNAVSLGALLTWDIGWYPALGIYPHRKPHWDQPMSYNKVIHHTKFAYVIVYCSGFQQNRNNKILYQNVPIIKWNVSWFIVIMSYFVT